LKILLVDDHALFREGVALLLARLQKGVSIAPAGSCEEALAILEREGPVDLVLMDLGLPEMSGLDGISIMRQRYPEIPVVALSSSDDKQTVLSALDRGAMGFVPKSSSSDTMIAALRLILAKGIYLPPSVFLGDRQIGQGSVPTPHGFGESPAKAMRPADLGLTHRQVEVLYLILQGKSAKLISRELDLSASTVKAHTSAVLRALNVTTRTQAVVAAGRLGLKFD
jgi:DNA-binding NarL/FixJ family response regulator